MMPTFESEQVSGADEGNPRSKVDVSVLVPVYNEGRFIEATAHAMRNQLFEGKIEFIFLDGGSTDQTKAILLEIAAGDSRVRVLDNPARRQAPALNIGLANACGEYVARMDAHAFYPPDYLARGVERLRQGGIEHVSGSQIAEGDEPGSARVALALTSPLGVGGASFRRVATAESEVYSGFTGMWRRETLLRHGGWDERWLVNEDGELAARIRAAGGRLVCVPEMAARYVPRNNLRELARQYWAYGNYRAKTTVRHPASARPSNALPPALVLATAAAAFGPRRQIRRAARVAVLSYLVIVGTESVRLARRAGRQAAWAPVVLATMHYSWGSGYLWWMMVRNRSESPSDAPRH